MMPQRPVFFEPLKTRLPLPALVSIAHRLTGLALVFIAPMLLFVLSYSLQAEAHFLFVQQRLAICPYAQFFVWGSLSVWFFHTLAGLRHLVMDAHFFDDLPSARLSAALVFGLSFLFALCFGVVLWA